MNSKEDDAFCEPCREAIVMALYQRAPTNLVRQRRLSDKTVLSVETSIPNARIQWRGLSGLSGREVSISKDQEWSSVTVTITDPKGWVRDSGGLRYVKSSFRFYKDAEKKPVVLSSEDAANLDSQPETK